MTLTKVLVVEDTQLNMELVFELLELLDFTYEGAVSGEEALEKCEKEVYDLIIMDIELSGIDGVQVTKVLKNNPDYKDIPIIAITAYAMQGDEKFFMSLGFDGYMPKPIEIDAFLKLLGNYK